MINIVCRCSLWCYKDRPIYIWIMIYVPSHFLGTFCVGYFLCSVIQLKDWSAERHRWPDLAKRSWRLQSAFSCPVSSRLGECDSRFLVWCSIQEKTSYLTVLKTQTQICKSLHCPWFSNILYVNTSPVTGIRAVISSFLYTIQKTVSTRTWMQICQHHHYFATHSHFNDDFWLCYSYWHFARQVWEEAEGCMWVLIIPFFQEEFVLH